MDEDKKTESEENKNYKSHPLFGWGVLENKKVPIKLLDKFIIGAVIIAIILIAAFSMSGGFKVIYDTDGGTEIKEQRVKYGDFISPPESPEKPGYEFMYWTADFGEGKEEWRFESSPVESDLVLYAVYKTALIKVKFDLMGGESKLEDKTVTYGEKYGLLPIPEKEGQVFEGWIYSGENITEDTLVKATGEHVLTAVWREE